MCGGIEGYHMRERKEDGDELLSLMRKGEGRLGGKKEEGGIVRERNGGKEERGKESPPPSPYERMRTHMREGRGEKSPPPPPPLCVHVCTQDRRKKGD